MARKPFNAPKQLTAGEINRGILRLDERISELEAFNVALVPAGSCTELTALSAAVTDTLDRCFGVETAARERFKSASRLQLMPMVFSDSYPMRQHYQDGARENIRRSVALLKEAQRVLREDLADIAEKAEVAPGEIEESAASNKVFIVHGHDEAALQGLARFVEKLSLEAVILKEQPNQGRTIIEKFEALAQEVGFAVVLMTPDDIGKANDGTEASRARQNVLFELGYFSAKLGRGKTCLLKKGQIEIPSDLFGIIYTDMDEADGWKMKLLLEMKAAGLQFDANKAWG